MKKALVTGLIIAFMISGVAAGWYYYNQKISSPEYSLHKIKESIDNHDVATFEKYVDVEGVFYRLLTDLPKLINEKSGPGTFGFIPEETVHLINNMIEVQVKNALQQTLKESVRSFIERGYFDKQLTQKGSFSNLMGLVPIDSLEVVSLSEIKKEGKICKVSVEAYMEKYDGHVDFEFMMRDKESHWQIAEIIDINDTIQKIITLKKEYPYKKLIGTAEYLSASIPDDDVEFLILLVSAYSKVGKIEEAISIAESINDSGAKAYALMRISESLARNNDIERALTIIRGLSEPEAQAFGLSTIALVSAESGDVQEVYDIGNEVLKEYNSANWWEHKAVLGAAFSITGKEKEADVIFSEIFEKITAPDFRGDPYDFIFASLYFGKAGKQRQAVDLLNKGITMAESVKQNDGYDFEYLLFRLGLYVICLSPSIDSDDVSVIYNKIKDFIYLNANEVRSQIKNRQSIDLMPKAREIAKQCEAYLQAHPSLKREDFFYDPEFSMMAVQVVGETGFTFLFQEPEPETGRGWSIWAHPNPNIIGIDDTDMIRKALGPYYEKFHQILVASYGGKESEGTHMWKDPYGKIREKYMFISPIHNIQSPRFYIGLTYYTDEYKNEGLEEINRIYSVLGAAYAFAGFSSKALEVTELIENKEMRKSALGYVCAALIPIPMSPEEEKALAGKIMRLIDVKPVASRQQKG